MWSTYSRIGEAPREIYKLKTATDEEEESDYGKKEDKNKSFEPQVDFQDEPRKNVCVKLSHGQPRRQNHYPKRKRKLPVRLVDQNQERQLGKDTIKRVKVTERISYELVPI